MRMFRHAAVHTLGEPRACLPPEHPDVSTGSRAASRGLCPQERCHRSFLALKVGFNLPCGVVWTLFVLWSRCYRC